MCRHTHVNTWVVRPIIGGSTCLLYDVLWILSYCRNGCQLSPGYEYVSFGSYLSYEGQRLVCIVVFYRD